MNQLNICNLGFNLITYTFSCSYGERISFRSTLRPCGRPPTRANLNQNYNNNKTKTEPKH